MAGGATAQWGFKTETTPGTAVTVDKFLPFVSESVKNDITKLDTQTLSARRVLRLTKTGTQSIGGTITTELPNTTMATLLTHMFGSVVTAGGPVYTHTATPGTLTGDSLTVQIGRPATTDTVHPFTYAGCKIRQWTIRANVGEIAQLELDIIGMSETTGTALASASYSATWNPFTFIEAAVTVAGSAVASVKSFELTGENSTDTRFRMGSGTSKEPLETGLRSYTGTVTTDFDALTHYALYTASTQTAIVFTFSNGVESLVITTSAQFTGETPEVSGNDLLEQPLPFRLTSTTSDAAAITAVLTNAESSAA